MKRNILCSLLGLLLLAGCSEEEITPQLDMTPEYEKQLAVDENSSQIDKTIYDWYKKYNSAFLYKFEDKDISWTWTSTQPRYYVPWDVTNEEDMAMLEIQLAKVEEYLLSRYEEDVLKKFLPYKVFLVKELRSTNSTLSSAYAVALYNGQDAMFVGYLQRRGALPADSKFDSELSSILESLVFSNLEQYFSRFMDSRVPVNFKLLSWPEDPSIEEEQKIKPDFENDNHLANVCGYIIGYNISHTQLPTEIQDYADYLTFLTKNPGSEIRKITNFYWRVAWRASLFMEGYKVANGKDLIEVQNAAFPNDKVTMEDFKY